MSRTVGSSYAGFASIGTHKNPVDKRKLVLLVDKQERNNAKRQNHEWIKQQLEQYGIPCETATLPVGDFLWVLRHHDDDDEPDLLIEKVIERKATYDLSRGLTQRPRGKNNKNKREYGQKSKGMNTIELQMSKLKSCGIQNKIILVEGGSIAHSAHPSLSDAGEHEFTKKEATQLFVDQIENDEYPGFTLVRTTSLSETIRFLIRQHYEIDSNRRPAGFTLDEVKRRVERFERDPQLLYYQALIEVPSIGHYTTRAIMSEYPTWELLEDFCRTTLRPEMVLSQFISREAAKNVACFAKRRRSNKAFQRQQVKFSPRPVAVVFASIVRLHDANGAIANGWMLGSRRVKKRRR